MIFDPFGDFSTTGYLRNIHHEKDMDVVKSMEHQSFLKNLPGTIDWISQQPHLDYDVLLNTHARIFNDLYPWAGQDRLALTPTRSVRKGDVHFADPVEIQTVFVQAMHQRSPGAVLGGLALAHPFLDGNGRALAVFFGEHQRRNKQLVRWDRMSKNDYLAHLTWAISGNTDPLDRLLKSHSVPFLFQRPETDRMSRVLAGIDWSDQQKSS